MENYVDKPYPTKAGVYAVRAGPIVAENIDKFIFGQALTAYVPQTGFLSLLGTGDGSCIGSKSGISFVGKWVWKMKDFIDTDFMNLFDPNFLFKDYLTKGTAEAVTFEDKEKQEKERKTGIEEVIARVMGLEP